MNKLQSFFKFVLYLILFFFTGILAAWIVMVFSLQKKEVVVPDLIGKDIIYALEKLSDSGLSPRFERLENSNIIAKNHIISQSPEPGNLIKKDRPVSLIISMGSKDVVMPDLIGESMRRSLMVLDHNDLKLGYISRIHSNKIRKDVIIDQTPGSRTTIKRGSTVNLLVSDGREFPAYMMPDLVGKSLNESMDVINKLGMKLSKIEYVEYDGIRPGMVISHNPGYGSAVKRDDSIGISLSKSSAKKEADMSTYTLLHYMVPQGIPKRVKIEVENEKEVKIVYDKMEKGGTNINLLIEIYGSTTARIFLDDALVDEKIY